MTFLWGSIKKPNNVYCVENILRIILNNIHDDEPTLSVLYDSNGCCNDGLHTSSEAALMQIQAAFLLIDVSEDFVNAVFKCKDDIFYVLKILKL